MEQEEQRTDVVKNDQAFLGIAKESQTLKESGKGKSCPNLVMQSYC